MARGACLISFIGGRSAVMSGDVCNGMKIKTVFETCKMDPREYKELLCFDLAKITDFTKKYRNPRGSKKALLCL